MRRGQFLFWSLITLVTAASAGVVYRTIEPLPLAEPTPEPAQVRELPAAAAAALNRCFDRKPPADCKSEARTLLASFAAANSDEMGISESSSAFNVSYFIRSEIAPQTSIVFWKTDCTDDAFKPEMFVANVFPRMKQDLTEKQVKSGYAVHGFPPSKRAVRVKTGCVAAQKLPDFPLSRAIVGQYNRAGPNKGFVWMERMALSR